MTDNESRAMGTCGHRAAVRLSGLCISCMARELDLAEQRGAERTASGYAALVDAARGCLERWDDDHFHCSARSCTLPRERRLYEALRAALGALR